MRPYTANRDPNIEFGHEKKLKNFMLCGAADCPKKFSCPRASQPYRYSVHPVQRAIDPLLSHSHRNQRGRVWVYDG